MKCIPITRSGRFVTAPSVVIEIDDVLLARIAFAGVADSILPKSSSLVWRCSVAASIAISTSTRVKSGLAVIRFLDVPVEQFFYTGDSSVHAFGADVVQQHVVPRMRGDLCDPGTHLTGTDNENSHYPTFTSTASP